MLPRSFHVSQIAFGIPRIECSEIAQVTRFSTILSSAERLHSITTAEIKEIFFETLKTKDIVLTDAAAEEIQTLCDSLISTVIQETLASRRMASLKGISKDDIADAIWSVEQFAPFAHNLVKKGKITLDSDQFVSRATLAQIREREMGEMVNDTLLLPEHQQANFPDIDENYFDPNHIFMHDQYLLETSE